MSMEVGDRSSSRPAEKPAPKAEPKKPDKVESAPSGKTETAPETKQYKEQRAKDGYEPPRPAPKQPMATIDPAANATAAEPSKAAEQAKELIKKHTNTLGLNLDEAGLGKELADMAKDPAKNGEVIKEVFNQLGVSFLGGDNKEQVANEMVKNMSDDQLAQAASAPEGREMLENVKTQLERNGVSGAEKASVDRINNVLYPEPKTLDEIKEGLKAGRTDDNFRNGVAKYFGSQSAADAHTAMESIRADGLQRQLIDSVMRDKDGNQADVRLRDGIEKMLDTGRVDFMVTQISSKSFNVFSGELHGTTDNHFNPSGDANEGVYITVDRANDMAELPRTLVHETFHAFARDNGSAYGAAEEGLGISLIHYAFEDGQYNVAETIYGTKNWYRDDGKDGDIEMGNFENASPLLREVLQSVSARDESQVAWDDPAQLQSEYEKFWEGTKRFPADNWFANVPFNTQSMLYERERAQLEAQGLSPEEIIAKIGKPPEPPAKP